MVKTGRPRLYDVTRQVTTSIQGIFYDLAREKHLSWKVCLEAGIKLLAQGGDSPNLNKEIIEKHIKNAEVMTEIVDEKEKEIEMLTEKLKNVRKKETTTARGKEVHY